MQQLQQEDWIKQQMYEKQNKKEADADDEQYRHDLHTHYNQLLQKTQEQHAQTRKDMFIANQDTNFQLAREKRDRDQANFESGQDAGKSEINFTLNHDFMTENPATEQSMLAQHRVKPYHFKGLNQEQQDAILHERAQQVREADMKKQTKQEEERLWALQQE